MRRSTGSSLTDSRSATTACTVQLPWMYESESTESI